MKKAKKESFIQGVLALMFSQVIIKILGLIYSMYLTNREGFGDAGNAVYMGGYQIYALLLTLSSIGVPNAISKLISERLARGDKKGADRVFKIAFMTFAVIGFIGTLILFLGARAISNYWLAIPECEYTLVALSPAIFFVSISSVIRGYFNGVQKISNTARSQTLEQVFKTTLTILFVEIVAMMTTTNTTLMAAGANLATTFATFLSFTYIFALCQRNRKIDRKEVTESEYVGEKESAKSIVKKILAVSIPMSISSLLSSINKNIDSATVVRILKPLVGEASAKARYGILSSKIDILTSMPLAFNIAFATALVPAISAARVKGDEKTINKRLSFSLLVTILIGLPCTIGMFMYANQILALLFPKASKGGTLLAISAFTIIFTVLAQTINGALQGLGKVRVPAIALGCGVIVKLLTNVLLIPIEGIYENGAAIGSVLCHIISFTIVYNVLKHTVKLEFSILKMMIKPLVATLIMAGVSYVCYLSVINLGIAEMISTIIGIGVAVVVYAIMVIILKILSKEDILSLPKGEKIYKILQKMKIYA